MTPSNSWRGLLNAELAPRFALLCLGIWLNAADTLVTVTIMPSVAREIGGWQYFGWSIAAFLLGSILAGACAGKLSIRFGLRRATALAGVVYAIGCAMGAAAPDFLVFVAGRLVQGLGAGAIVSLCYVAISAMFPESLWPRVYGAIAGVWGAATLLGPLCGGLFAEAGFWRGAFWFFVVQAVIFVGAVLVMVPAAPKAPEGGRIPGRQLALLTVGVTLIAAAGVVPGGLAAALCAAFGTLAMAAMLAVNARTGDRLLPRAAGDLATATGLGLMVIFFCEAATVGFSVYGPTFIQVLHGADPLLSGYVIGGIAAGWTALSFVVAGLKPRHEGLAIRVGALVIAAGVTWGAYEMVRGGLVGITLSMVLLGGGFGICWAFLAKRVIGGAPLEEQPLASAAVPTTQLIGGATGAAAAGALANALGFAHGVTPAGGLAHGLWLFAAFIPLALAGLVAAWRLGRG
ncbi:MFS transporter [Caulobacter sp. BE254]|uniref:MFS transporter n=1 Tax=Caulobacter sp. BE254 TaxID=2817720 RepID=UPI00285AA7C3|nr:MFS transporter [Caulobacter sp. BE254]MDR7116502.1 MFS family permease [Caulobacter sp. BE254]